MNGLQVISDSETQDYVPKPSKFIISIPIERPNAQKKNLSQNKLFGAPTIDFGLTKEALTIHPYDNKQTTSWKRKDELSPNDFLAYYVAKKGKIMTRWGFQQKSSWTYKSTLQVGTTFS